MHVWFFTSVTIELAAVGQEAFSEVPKGYRIPLNLSYEEPNQDPLESIREADAIIAKGGPGYRPAEEMFSAMGGIDARNRLYLAVRTR